MVNSKSLVLLTVLLNSINANADWFSSNADGWRVETKSRSGPLLQVDLPNSNGKNRVAFVVFEYSRQCDPIFSYAELFGNSFGTPLSQEILKNSKIGIILNGSFYTWHSAITKYENGYEAGFGVPNGLALQLLVNTNSLSYVTPSGEVIALPTKDFQQGFLKAIEICKKKSKGSSSN